MRRFIFLILFLNSVIVSAKAYKCEIKGQTTYQQAPCPDDGKEFHIRKDLNDADRHAAIQQLTNMPYIRLGQFKVRTEPTNSIGDKWFSYQVSATNASSDPQELSLTYQGIDLSGFQVSTVYLRGTVRANSYALLTDRSFLPWKDYQRVYKWVLVNN